MQAVLATRNPSVYPSVKRVNFDQTKETRAKILIPCKRSIRHRLLVYMNLRFQRFIIERQPTTASGAKRETRSFRNVALSCACTFAIFRLHNTLSCSRRRRRSNVCEYVRVTHVSQIAFFFFFLRINTILFCQLLRYYKHRITINNL